MAKVKKKLSAKEKVEQGYLGLKYTAGMNGGNIYEEKRPDLVFPQSIATFQYMSQHSIIAASINLITTMIGKVNWKFDVPDDATGKMKDANKMLNYFMNNMDHSWKSFIREVLSYLIYGFYPAEKVWREIPLEESKKWSGKIGWKKLATRSQSTISKWDFDENVREFKGLYQSLDSLTNIYKISATNGKIFIPKDKLLLFSYRSTRGNPEGHSPLKDCWQSWNVVKTIEGYESVGVAKDLGGIPVFYADAFWLAKAQEDASSTEAAVLADLQTQMENLHAGEQLYMILPLAYTDNGKELFKFELKGVDGGGKNYNTRDIINGKQLEIMMIFLTDILRVGNENHGSFSLAESKQNLTSFGIEDHLQFIVSVIQEQLIPQTLMINGFDLPKEQHPVLTYSDLDNESIDELGKLVQRLASTNMIPRSVPIINEILERGGFKYRLTDGDADPDGKATSKIPYSELFTTNESGASEGMIEGLNSGTGSAEKNNSSLNADNAS